MQTHLVLDLHGVILSGVDQMHADFLREVPVDDESWAAILADFLDTPDGWGAVECGRVSFEAFCDDLARKVTKAGFACTPSQAGHVWGRPHPFAQSSLRWELLRFVEDINATVPVSIATNNAAAWRESWTAMIPQLDRFYRIFDSCEMGVRKPEAGFWRAVETGLSSSGAQIVFVDDRAPNVEAAQAHGWRAILFRDERQTVHELTESLK